jgi:hypothetical protein
MHVCRKDLPFSGCLKKVSEETGKIVGREMREEWLAQGRVPLVYREDEAQGLFWV